MQPSEIAKYFHLPLVEAAKKLQICTSSLKAICRKHGITRWPQRKVSFSLLCAFLCACMCLFILTSKYERFIELKDMHNLRFDVYYERIYKIE